MTRDRAIGRRLLSGTLLLAIVGALLGVALAWLLFEGRQIYAWGVFKLHIPAEFVALGLGWALAIALLSAFFPALRAGRLPAVEALRAD